ncbi:hypothetical protein GCM10023322_32500 [Rugosimonospora acidiphila]|uniref:Hemerythrin-like domain-containing protein n=1 Tax=Rugosimonospora acidiphila TaxID=556531 RepID=A0ABP9RTT4_9ACTN
MTTDNRDDIVEVLLKQHERLRELCAAVQAAGEGQQPQLFGKLCRLVHLHELGERAVVHPVTRDQTGAGGDAVAVARAGEEDRAGWAIAELQDLGADHPAFAAKFTAFHRAVLDHAGHEERDEFPRLRLYVPIQRLYTMADHLRNVQAMS